MYPIIYIPRKGALFSWITTRKSTIGVPSVSKATIIANREQIFVTLCLQEREPYLEMHQVHHIVEDTWKALPQRFPTIELDEFAIMPDHIHFILNLHLDHTHRPTLSHIVGTYKSLTARAALSHLRTRGDICGTQFWQQHFYDHIIYNNTELQAIRKYIRNNPLKARLL